MKQVTWALVGAVSLIASFIVGFFLGARFDSDTEMRYYELKQWLWERLEAQQQEKAQP